MPYWLRGGVITGTISIFSVGILFGCSYFLNFVFGEEGFACVPFAIISPLLPFYLLWDRNLFFHSLPFLLSPLFGTIIWFLLGSFAGFLIGLIKKKSPSVRWALCNLIELVSDSPIESGRRVCAVKINELHNTVGVMKDSRCCPINKVGGWLHCVLVAHWPRQPHDRQTVGECAGCQQRERISYSNITKHDIGYDDAWN